MIGSPESLKQTQLPQIQDILKIINKKYFSKTQNDLDYIDDYISGIQFVSNLKSKLPTKLYHAFLNELQVEKCEPLKIIFNHGDIGRKFYIIMDGRLLILTPNNTNLQSQTKPELFSVEVSNFLQNEFASWNILGVLQPGQSFGEIALMYDQGRSATIFALNDSLLLSINRDAYKKIIECFQLKQYDEKLDFLKSTYLFKDWQTSNLVTIICNLECTEFERGQIVYNEGDPTQSIYLIKEGEIQIYKTINNIPSQQDVEEIMLKNHALRNQWNEELMKFNYLEQGKQSRLFQKKVRVAIIGQRENFGQEEVFKDLLKRNNTAMCYSHKVVLFIINKKYFINNLPNKDLLISFLSDQQKRDTQRTQLTKNATSLANISIIESLAAPIPLKNIFEDSLFVRLKRQHIHQSMPYIQTQQINESSQPKNTNQLPSLNVGSGSIDMRQSPELSLYQSKQENKILQKQLIISESCANYKKKRFNNPVSQECFINSLIKEKIKLKQKLEYPIKRRNNYTIFIPDNSFYSKVQSKCISIRNNSVKVHQITNQSSILDQSQKKLKKILIDKYLFKE